MFSFLLQGLPSCPVSLEALRSHLPYLGYCLNFSDDKSDQHSDDDNNTNNNNFVIGELYGNQKDQFAPNLTPLHRFYREQQQRKKMPGFRGRRGLCGCFQVSYSQTDFDWNYTFEFELCAIENRQITTINSTVQWQVA